MPSVPRIVYFGFVMRVVDGLESPCGYIDIFDVDYVENVESGVSRSIGGTASGRQEKVQEWRKWCWPVVNEGSIASGLGESEAVRVSRKGDLGTKTEGGFDTLTCGRPAGRLRLSARSGCEPAIPLFIGTAR